VDADPSQLKTTEDASTLVEAGEHTHWWDFVLRIVPDSVVAPFVEGEILQIIFLAVIFGVALNAVGPSVPRS
jgi:aerobic C4-dicarboxylate transport protein